MTKSPPLHRSTLLLVLLLVFTNVFPLPTLGEESIEEDETAQGEEWRYTFVPLYIWASGITGSQTVGEGSSEIEVEFSTILDNLEAGYTFYFEAGKGPWSLWIDTQFMDIRPDIETDLVPIDVRVQATVVQGALAYRLAPYWDIYAGARSTETEFRLGIGSLDPIVVDDTTVDFIIGTRFRKAMSERWTGSLGVDLGFGGNDLSWQALAIFQARLSQRIFLSMGARFLGVESSDNDSDEPSETDVLAAGPFLGVAFRW